MTAEKFKALVLRFEESARRHPAAYRARLMAIALLGNAYLAVIVFVLAQLLLVALISIVYLKAFGVKLAAVAAVFLWLVLKALWVVVPPPQGTEVRRRDAPELFGMIDELRRALRAPRFHHVLVTDDFNAAVVQAPRLGIFGWYRNYLLIGLPFAKALTAEQFKAVLAHEFGHLARGHGRTSNWIYRQRLRWGRLLAALEGVESKGMFLFKPFLRWYAPYFNAYSFPLARANEFEADATSARLTSARAAAEALTGVDIVGSYLDERYWPRINRQADELPQPAFAPYGGMSQGLASEIDATSTQAWLEHALARETTLDDTHPSFRERLAALGESPRLALPVAGAAADRLFGPSLAALTQALDQRWHEGVLPAWERRYREVQEARRRLAELDAKHAAGELTAQEAYDRAMLTESVGSNPDAALEQLRSLHARLPQDAAVLYSLGVRLLRRGDDAGIALVEQAMQRDEAWIVRGCEAMRDYQWRKGYKEAAQEWHARMAARIALEQAAAKERSVVRIDDKFERYDLPSEALARLQAQLRAVKGLRKAYFVKKKVHHFPHRPTYVLGYTVRGWHTEQRAAEVMRAIQANVTFPCEAMILNVEGENYRFGRKFRWMRGSRIL